MNQYLIDKKFVGKNWRIFRQVTKIFTNEYLMQTEIITNEKFCHF